MKRESAEVARQHREATELARRSACLLCGREGTCVPAHFSKHTGIGGSKTKWERRKWLPLCGQPGGCHDLVDARLGIGSQAGHEAWIAARSAVGRRAAGWWTE